MSAEPDPARAIARYRTHAEGYDASAARTMPLRRRTFAAAQLGARVAASGSKLLPRWLGPLNAVVRRINAPYVTTFAGMDRPWRYLIE